MDMIKKIALVFLVVIIALVLFLPSSPINIQTQSVTHPIGIAGYVKRTNGDIVSDADVTVAGQIVKTDENGRFIITTTGYTGQQIKIDAGWNGITGSATLTVDLSNPTQWMDVIIGDFTPYFVWSPAVPKPGETVTFKDLSNGPIRAWSWTFSDMTAGVSQRNPTHVFKEAGTYSVTLIVTDDIGTTKSTTRQVVVKVPPTYYKLLVKTKPDNCSVSVCLAVGLSSDDLVCKAPKTSGAEGEAEYTGLSPGTYAVSVGKPGYVYKTLTLTVDADKTIEVDLTSGENERINPFYLVIGVIITALILVIVVYVRRKRK